jgi:hypothetical protein
MSPYTLSITAASISAVTAAAIIVITNVAAAFICRRHYCHTTVSSTSAVSAVFTTATSVSSTSASDRLPHSVNSVRLWSYHPPAPFSQSVMNI